MKTSTLKLTTAALLLSAFLTPAQAHFLYASVSPDKATFEFAESPGDDQLPDLAGKLSDTEFLAFPQPGSKGTKISPHSLGHIATVPVDRQVVAANLLYGILDRSEGGRGIFRLEYYAKATQSWAQAAEPVGQSYEILLKKSGDRIQITPVVNRKPANSEIVIYRRGQADQTLLFTGTPLEISTKDLVAVRGMHAIEKPGELDGKKYELIRQYATITAPAEADVPAGGDINAWYLLKHAYDARESFTDEIANISGTVISEASGKSTSTPFVYTFGNGLDFPGTGELPNEDVQHQIESIFSHRRGRNFVYGDGKNPIVFTGNNNANGIQVALQSDSQSTYRIKDNVITEVRRSIPTGYFIISVLDTLDTKFHSTLSQLFTVTYYDKAGQIKSVETFQDTYTIVEGFYLPAQRIMTTTTPEGAQTVVIKFEDLKLTLRERS